MPRAQLPILVRHYIRHCLIGFGLSALFVAALLALDVVGLRRLIFGSDVAGIAIMMLWVFNGIVFAGVQFGVSIMLMAEGQGPKGGKRQGMGWRSPTAISVGASHSGRDASVQRAG